MNPGPAKRAASLTVRMPSRLLEAITHEAERRKMTVEGFVNEVLDDFCRLTRARRPALVPPARPERSTVVIHDPEGRIRDLWQGRTMGEPWARGRATS